MIQELLNDKSKKPKEKTEALCKAVADGVISIPDLLAFANAAKDPAKATCIEALEYATKNDPSVLPASGFDFVVASLAAKAPRVKWESARVIGNIAARFEKKLDEAIAGLLINSEHEGTVVRWSTAYALGEILKLKTTRNKTLLPAVEAIVAREEQNSIKKIYLAAIKKLQ